MALGVHQRPHRFILVLVFYRDQTTTNMIRLPAVTCIVGPCRPVQVTGRGIKAPHGKFIRRPGGVSGNTNSASNRIMLSSSLGRKLKLHNAFLCLSYLRLLLLTVRSRRALPDIYSLLPCDTSLESPHSRSSLRLCLVQLNRVQVAEDDFTSTAVTSHGRLFSHTSSECIQLRFSVHHDSSSCEYYRLHHWDCALSMIAVGQVGY